MKNNCIQRVDSSKCQNDAENLALLNKSFDVINIRFLESFRCLEGSTTKHRMKKYLLGFSQRLIENYSDFPI